MLGQNFVDLLYGFLWKDLTWKEPYNNMEPEEVFQEIDKTSACIEDPEYGHISAMSLLYDPENEQYYIGIRPGYTREVIFFDVWEQVHEYIIKYILPFVEEDEIELNRLIDEYVVYTG